VSLIGPYFIQRLFFQQSIIISELILNKQINFIIINIILTKLAHKFVFDIKPNFLIMLNIIFKKLDIRFLHHHKPMTFIM